jgi:phosphatidylserine/phosphatidylglycerophosphate/cardiolipin synthase-like enzyme
VASFVPPIEGSFTVSAPTRTLLDDSGHCAVLLSEITGPVKAVAPIRSYAKPIAIGGDFLVELSPLPSPAQAAGVFSKLAEAGATMPTFYIGWPGIDPNESGLVEVGEEIVSGPPFRIGATLGPCALAPREWARVLLEAMTAASETDLGPWTAFLTNLGTDQALYVLRHTGQPPAPDEMEFDIRFANGATSVVTIGDGADLAAAVAPGDLFKQGARIRLRTPAGGIPYHTAYDSDLRSSAELQAPADERWFRPSEFPGDVGTILCTDLNGWFGERPAGLPLPRWHTGNRVEPLLDGIETFERLWADLEPLRAPATGALRVARDGTPLGYWAAGLVFHDFELIPGVEESKFVDLVKTMDGHGFQVRLLGAKGFMFDGTETDEQIRLLALALLFVTAGIGLGSVALEALGMDASDETWTRLTFAAVVLAVATSPLFVDKISDKLDFSKEAFEALTPDDGTEPRIALWSRYPARFSDNPSADYPAAVIEQLIAVERTGWHHMKIQVLALPQAGETAPPEYVAYLGGIDLNKNRIDSWAHRWPPNYHDVHVRVTGPAAADVFQMFYERWDDELPRRPAEEGLAAGNTCPRHSPRPGSGHAQTDSLSAIPADGDEIVQIARTLYRPAPANANQGFWYAPEGEASVHDSILRAIHSAREYIYIEDQYMTPADARGAGDEILEALQEAATRCKALILVFSQGTLEQLFGRERRNALFARLQASWSAQPGRVFLPLIHTRQLLGPADRISARGRTVLKSQIATNATQVRVVDGIRVPPAPCWAWIEGELVLVQDVDVDTATGEAALVVARAPAAHLDSWPRIHEAGAPVTFVNLDDVFIHAKVVLIDDVYASIGSANMNRRAMFHDGELNAMVVPGRLRAAANNPVRSLRARIWADHLGIPPQVAESTLADPLAALPLFARPRAAGNPLSRHEIFDDTEAEGIEIRTKSAVQALSTVFGGLGQVGGDIAKAALWRTLIDPTTSLDPFFDTEPFDL